MDIAFINAIRPDVLCREDFLVKRYMANLGPIYLAGYLRKNGFEGEVHIKNHLSDIEALRPPILGISSVTENFDFARELARQAKASWNPITLIGGVHISSLPGFLPPEFDIGVIGEGEETLLELLKNIETNGSQLNQDALKNIPGILFHGPQGLVKTPKGRVVPNLDTIPIPPREDFIKSLGGAYMMTSRGCPYTCDFCVIPNLTNGYRKHSPEFVLREIKSIKANYPYLKHIRFFDDLFIVDMKRVKKIAELIEAEGLNQDLSFSCWGRANLIDEEAVKIFQKMNMKVVAFGAESGSSKIMSQIKPGCSVEQNQNAIDLLAGAGLRACCSILLGHPKESEQDLADTYRFIEKNMDQLFEIEFNVAIPWPGTELWHYAFRKGMVREDMSFSGIRECGYFSNYSTDLHPYLNEHIPAHRFEKILVDFKKLHKKMMNKISSSTIGREVSPLGDIPALY
jgi:radical SAM superfamily enzyme YgiQ (UPF0313 family)